MFSQDNSLAGQGTPILRHLRDLFVLMIEYGEYKSVEGRGGYPSDNKLDFQKFDRIPCKLRVKFLQGEMLDTDDSPNQSAIHGHIISRY